MKEKLKNNKKKIIISLVTLVVLSVGAMAAYIGIGYNYAKNNENYSEKEAREIATQLIKGEITHVNKDFELEEDQLSRSQFEYTFEIKTSDNQLHEVEVSSRTGTIDADHSENDLDD